MVISDYLKKSTEWFSSVKAPDLKTKVDAIIKKIELKTPLDENERKTIGFIIFDYSMHKGPSSFLDAEECATNTGVVEEMRRYANDWISFSKNKIQEDGRDNKD